MARKPSTKGYGDWVSTVTQAESGRDREGAEETRSETPLGIVLGRKWLILATVVISMAATYFVSSGLQKVYTTEATLLIALPSDDTTFDSVQAGQAIARSYADVIDSPNIAADVAERVGEGVDGGDVADATSFETVPETQLLKISTEATTPERAKEIADGYASVFTEYARENLSETTEAEIELADAAPLPSAAARPKPVLYTLIAGVLALALATALSLAAHRLDRRLRTWDEVEKRFGLPLLARVPLRRRSQASVTAFEEAFRILRTNLQFTGEDGGPKSIALVSERPGEGKTTSVAKLAEAVAEAGRKVIVIEADFRRPALEGALTPDRKELTRPGLSNYLVGASSLDDVVHGTGRPNLEVVPSGPLPPSPSALLDTTRARDLVGQFARRADLVLIDCPPLGVGADASVTTKWVEGVALVVDMESATDNSIRNALRQLEAVHAPVIGILLNRDREIEESAYDDYYHGADRERERVSTGEEAAEASAASNGSGSDEVVKQRRRLRFRRQREKV